MADEQNNTEKNEVAENSEVNTAEKEKVEAPPATNPVPGPEPKPTQAQIGFGKLYSAIRRASPCPVSIEEFELWTAPIIDAINKQAAEDRKTGC